jgi:hypothetical protein
VDISLGAANVIMFTCCQLHMGPYGVGDVEMEFRCALAAETII